LYGSTKDATGGHTSSMRLEMIALSDNFGLFWLISQSELNVKCSSLRCI
jgi:hypothetical protein